MLRFPYRQQVALFPQRTPWHPEQSCDSVLFLNGRHNLVPLDEAPLLLAEARLPRRVELSPVSQAPEDTDGTFLVLVAHRVHSPVIFSGTKKGPHLRLRSRPPKEAKAQIKVNLGYRIVIFLFFKSIISCGSKEVC